jgi:hypothetical protein
MDWFPGCRTYKAFILSGRCCFCFVNTKDGLLELCIDCRGLNNITVKNKYPLPLISSAFAPLHGSTRFTKLNLRNAYHLVHIREGDEWKSVFNTPVGHFEYLVMPLGLTNAPAVFQNLVNDVLRVVIGCFILSIWMTFRFFSKDLEAHQQHVLQWLWENTLYVKAEKCEFHASSVFPGLYYCTGGVMYGPCQTHGSQRGLRPQT